MADLILILLMFAGVILTVGAVRLYRNGGDRKKAMLMFVAAFVMFANLAIWIIPTSNGTSLNSHSQQPE